MKLITMILDLVAESEKFVKMINVAIVENNRVAGNEIEQARLDGRLEAYYHVLKMLGVVKDEEEAD